MCAHIVLWLSLHDSIEFTSIVMEGDAGGKGQIQLYVDEDTVLVSEADSRQRIMQTHPAEWMRLHLSLDLISAASCKN